MSGDGPAVWQQFTGVVEGYDAVAEQGPSLFWVEGHQGSGVAVGSIRWWARGLMFTHSPNLILPEGVRSLAQSIHG